MRKVIFVTCVILFGQNIFAANAGKDLSAILGEMESADAHIREKAIWKIDDLYSSGRIDERRVEAISALKRHLRDPEKFVRYTTAYILTTIDSSDKEAIPVLIEALGEDGFSMDAALALPQYGPDAREAVPALIRAMKKRPEGKVFFIRALEHIGTPEALEAIKPHTQKMERQEKLVKPISVLSNSWIGSSLMALGFLGLFWWSRVRRKKGDRIISWPLLVPIPFWGICVYDVFYVRSHHPVITSFEIEIPFYVLLFILTLAGLIPWLLSLLWWRWNGNA